jgi:hypothetical protein
VAIDPPLTCPVTAGFERLTAVVPNNTTATAVRAPEPFGPCTGPEATDRPVFATADQRSLTPPAALP